jgi:hypothetical protein
VSKKDVKVCDDGTLVQILCFWTLFIVLFLSKSTFLFIFQNTKRTVFLDKNRTIMSRHNIFVLMSQKFLLVMVDCLVSLHENTYLFLIMKYVSFYDCYFVSGSLVSSDLTKY